MGAYLDTSWADLRALTRERRAQALEARIAALPAPVRFSAAPWVLPVEAIELEPARTRRKKAKASRWRLTQWQAGERRCGYCRIWMTLDSNRPTSATVDHRIPWSIGGPDKPINWIMACLRCNQAKGDMSEAAFRALICEALE